MENEIDKLFKAVNTLKANTEFTYVGDTISTQEHFNSIKWKTGEDSSGVAIETTTCPHSEITWTKVKTEMDKL